MLRTRPLASVITVQIWMVSLLVFKTIVKWYLKRHLASVTPIQIKMDGSLVLKTIVKRQLKQHLTTNFVFNRLHSRAWHQLQVQRLNQSTGDTIIQIRIRTQHPLAMKSLFKRHLKRHPAIADVKQIHSVRHLTTNFVFNRLHSRASRHLSNRQWNQATDAIQIRIRTQHPLAIKSLFKRHLKRYLAIADVKQIHSVRHLTTNFVDQSQTRWNVDRLRLMTKGNQIFHNLSCTNQFK